jgi:hypothetical protein
MKWLVGNVEELTALRSICEKVLGYPRQPDEIGIHVVSAQAAEHGYAIVVTNKCAYMSTDAELEGLMNSDTLPSDWCTLLKAKWTDAVDNIHFDELTTEALPQ